MQTIRLILALVVGAGLAACGGSPTGSEGPATSAASSAGTPPAASSQSAAPIVSNVATPSGPAQSDDGDGIPDDAELEARYEHLLSILAPPDSTLEARENPGLLDLGVFYVSTASLDALVSFYASAIPQAGLQITDFDDEFPDHREWLFEGGPEFFGSVSVRPAEGGYRVLLALLGIPPAG